ncbi:hypothetical protein B0H13DRAFT_2348559 [Mycena leptocephala]|nr:hypothetical protein B0H13DRAFT_2348559 [Mycena leptocephala]
MTHMLRQLDIVVPIHSVPSLPVAFHKVPLLRAATLWDFSYLAAFSPWSQLTSLILIAKEPYECTPILQQTTNLVHCELILFDETETPQPDDSATEYLECFIVPALCRLQIPGTFLALDPIATLTSFIPKFQCKLQRLHITGERSVSQWAYRKALPAVPLIIFNGLLRDCLTGEYSVGPRRSTDDF